MTHLLWQRIELFQITTYCRTDGRTNGRTEGQNRHTAKQAQPDGRTDGRTDKQADRQTETTLVKDLRTHFPSFVNIFMRTLPRRAECTRQAPDVQNRLIPAEAWDSFLMTSQMASDVTINWLNLVAYSSPAFSWDWLAYRYMWYRIRDTKMP